MIFLKVIGFFRLARCAANLNLVLLVLSILFQILFAYQQGAFDKPLEFVKNKFHNGNTQNKNSKVVPDVFPTSLNKMIHEDLD
ncbi:hypothetical protein BX661DRAFT_32316 [Kickxella alabastrina]|uniref:uncharacterized protein n=1 Tax=Kickxella alabastrina TaxID=61397 RepID=UPI0022204663|nr:uncharacterized protein BX661DRAFT_32316 [Kickxella alabastrina]KAI7826289.1 hypothetical protein BX661DRAFT_32316 [Kickxella alabastrina]